MRPIFQILHIDDDESYLNIFKALFSRNLPEALIISENCPEEAFYMLEIFSFDVIICDYQMPMNGLEFLFKVRKLGYKTPFILLTGNDLLNKKNIAKQHRIEVISKNHKFTNIFSTLVTNIYAFIEKQEIYSLLAL